MMMLLANFHRRYALISTILYLKSSKFRSKVSGRLIQGVVDLLSRIMSWPTPDMIFALGNDLLQENSIRSHQNGKRQY